MNNKVIKLPILTDGYQILIELTQSNIRCTISDCNTYINEEFTFIERNKRISNITPLLVLTDLKDISITCVI